MLFSLSDRNTDRRNSLVHLRSWFEIVVRHDGGMKRFPQGFWLNPPSLYQAADDCITLTTEPGTDFWQRTYYGFQNNNAHAYLWKTEKNFTFECTARCHYKVRFDQAGVLVWVDQFNWIKVSLEYEDESLSRLGAVVTNNGYSDWSTRNCETSGFIQYRVSQRGPDFLLEANEGGDWEQLRVCHLAVLGVTTADMGTLNATDLPAVPVSVGVYACSPGESSVEVEFDNIQYESSQWEFHL